MRLRSSAAAMVLSLLVVGSSNAAGVNLRWTNCYGDGGANNRTFACNTNTGVNQLVGSFVLGADLPQASGMDVVIDIASSGAALPAWWQFKNAGTCRTSSLSMNFVIPGTANVCADWASGQASGGIGSYTISGAAGPNTARISAAIAVPGTALVDLFANTEYFAFNVLINNAKTVGTGACSGCDVPVCIALSSVRVTTQITANNVTLSGPAYGVNSNLATWQSSPVGSVCALVDTPGFTVSASVLGRGTISRTPDRPIYTAGTPLTLIAQALPGDRFVAWSGDTTSTNAALSLSVLRDLTYFATFERDPAAAPTITLVRDVPNDQGSFVIANWNRSPLDDVAFPGVLCCYRLERTLSSAPGSPWVAASGSITASKASSYSQVVTTPADSMQGDPALRRYRVVAVASGNTGEWISNDIGGYSVDNLAPPAPSSVSGVVASGAASMFWSAVNVPDFAYYAIYRGLEPSPPSDSARRVGTTTATSFNDSPGYFAYYSVTAVDRHGNESPPTAFVTLNSTDAPGRQAPRAFTVGNPFPSPMRGSVSLSVGLPHPMPVTAAVWDSQGRLVRQLLDASSSSGWLTLAWDAHDSRGRDAAPGVYFLRVVTPEGRSVKRVVLVP